MDDEFRRAADAGEIHYMLPLEPCEMAPLIVAALNAAGYAIVRKETAGAR